MEERRIGSKRRAAVFEKAEADEVVACDEELGVGCSLEVSILLEGRDGDGVCALRLPDCSHGIERIPQGLKPPIVGGQRGPSLKAWRT